MLNCVDALSCIRKMGRREPKQIYSGTGLVNQRWLTNSHHSPKAVHFLSSRWLWMGQVGPAPQILSSLGSIIASYWCGEMERTSPQQVQDLILSKQKKARLRMPRLYSAGIGQWGPRARTLKYEAFQGTLNYSDRTGPSFYFSILPLGMIAWGLTSKAKITQKRVSQTNEHPEM